MINKIGPHDRQVPLIILLFLQAFLIMGCASTPILESTSTTAAILPTIAPISTLAPPAPTPTLDIKKYAFPTLIDPQRHYLFYLHGKIIEDQGIPAVSPDYGAYEYQAILEKLGSYSFIVISEQRGKDAKSQDAARRVAWQVNNLFEAGIPAKSITVVGASKGASIAILASNLIKNERVNFVILAGCDPATVDELTQAGVNLYGNVLAIYDSGDHYAGSCQELFAISEGKGLSAHKEIALGLGLGHGIVYQPLDAWIFPTVQWAGEQ